MKIKDLKKNYKDGLLNKEKFINEAMYIHQKLFDYFEVLKETDVKKINITHDGISFIIGNYEIILFIPPNEKRVAPLEIINFDIYEKNETYVIDLLSSESKHIIDIGANIGYHAIRFAKKNPYANIHAFEPMNTSYSYLIKNIFENKANSNIFSYNIALSDHCGEIDFFVPPANGTNASIINVSGDKNSKIEIIKTLTLDQWCKDQNVLPDFIKCDVEGAELLVFKGAKETLKKCTPLIFTELLRKWSKPYGYHPNNVINFFKELGYVCYGIGSQRLNLITNVNDQTIETNYIFVHQTKHSNIIDKFKNLKW